MADSNGKTDKTSKDDIQSKINDLKNTGKGEMARREAIWYLKNQKAMEAVDALIDCLANDKSRHVRRECAEALGHMKAAKAFEHLVTRLRDEDDELAAAAAAWALGELNDQRAAPDLSRVIDSDLDALRIEAAAALARMGDYSHFNVLIEEAANPLFTHNYKASAHIQMIPDAEARLKDMLSYDDPSVRASAANELMKLTHKRVPELEKLVASSHPEETTRRLVMERLPASIRRDIQPDIRLNVERIVKRTISQDGVTRDQAFRLLSGSNDPMVLAALIRMLKDRSGAVRGAAAQALGRMDNTAAIEPLADGLTDSDSFVLHQIACALANYRDERARESLASGLSSNDPLVRHNVALALAVYGDERSNPYTTYDWQKGYGVDTLHVVWHRDPRKYPWGVYVEDSSPLSSMAWLGWFETPTELLEYLAYHTPMSSTAGDDHENTSERIRIGEIVDHILRTTDYSTDLDNTIRQIGRVLDEEGGESIIWWGKFEDLCAGREGFAETVADDFYSELGRKRKMGDKVTGRDITRFVRYLGSLTSDELKG